MSYRQRLIDVRAIVRNNDGITREPGGARRRSSRQRRVFYHRFWGNTITRDLKTGASQPLSAIQSVLPTTPLARFVLELLYILIKGIND